MSSTTLVLDPMTSARRLNRLETLSRRFEPGLAREKASLLTTLARQSLSRPADVLRLHEVACFLRAYPDDRQVLAAAERTLARFERRPDVRRHAEALAETGIAGTPIHAAFHWVTSRWLLRHWPKQLEVDWGALDDSDRFFQLLALLVPAAEAPDPEQLPLSPREWCARLRGERETDAQFLIRRLEALEAEPRVKEQLFHSLALPMRLSAGRGTPSRTHAKLEAAASFRRSAFESARPNLRAALEPPRSIRSLSRREATAVIDRAREAMITRGRDLDGIIYASADDVRLIDCGSGSTMACLGLLPEQRALIETIYVFLLLQNGVPIGYFQSALLMGSAEVNYHVFASFRGAESAELYARALAVVHHLFGSDSFAVHPYQLGHENPDAHGAFWFYAKLGFEPADAGVRRLMQRELARIAKDPWHRSSDRVLDRLSSGYAFFHLGPRRDDIAGKVSLARIALAVSERLGRRFGADRERGIEVVSREAQALLGVRSLRGWSSDETLWWQRWAPLVVSLPGISRWKPQERWQLAELVRAKGGRREQPFAARLDRHQALRRALLALSRA